MLPCPQKLLLMSVVHITCAICSRLYIWEWKYKVLAKLPTRLTVAAVGLLHCGIQPNESAILLFPLLYIYGISTQHYVLYMLLPLYPSPAIYHLPSDFLELVFTWFLPLRYFKTEDNSISDSLEFNTIGWSKRLKVDVYNCTLRSNHTVEFLSYIVVYHHWSVKYNIWIV